MPLAGLLSRIEEPQGLVYGERLSVEDLLVVAQVEKFAYPALTGPPGACRPHPAAIKPGSVGPDGAAGPPAPGPLQGWTFIAN